jgi:pyrimidine-nucleoside phosphorylase
MNVAELIKRKRDRGRLSPEEIDFLVRSFAGGDLPDYQMSAWLMAAHIRGLTMDETTALTNSMVNSGEPLDLTGVGGPRVDKHSTGGVGDKVSLVLAPLVAACGVKVPMVSGRSLGHTGGTLDKLGAIPGFRTDLKPEEFRERLETVGVVMSGPTQKMCPADRKMYALRDVTGTVDSVPLIAASILSKKLAEGAEALVLDVKVGPGAFMGRVAHARRLARAIIDVGARLDRPVVALLTGMYQPLGQTVGNSVEVVEAIEALKGHWSDDLKAVTLALGSEMMLLAGKATSAAQARRLLLRALTLGKGLAKFRQMVEAQGGDPKVIDDYALLPQARATEEVRATADGIVRAIDALQVGLLGVNLGIGRTRVDSKVDYAAGMVFLKKAGDEVKSGEVLARVSSSDAGRTRAVAQSLGRAFTIGAVPPRPADVVIARLQQAPTG